MIRSIVRLAFLGLCLGLIVGCQATDFVGGSDATPQGQGIVYQWEHELWASEPGGQNARRLTADLANSGCTAYVVAPNGRSVAYIDRANTLWVASLPSGEVRQVSNGAVEDMAWFPNSRGLAYSNGSQLSLHFLARNEKMQQFNLQDRRIRRPTWSPDTKMIAFYLLRDQNKADLAVMPFPANTVNEVRILDSFTMEPGTCPPAIRWAPDNTRLVAGDGKHQFAYFLAGGSPIPLGAAESPAAWTTDSRRVAYLESNGRLVLRELAGSEVRPLASGGTVTYRWSPDGSRLAFTLVDAEGSKLMLFDQATQQRTTLVSGGVVAEVVPQWSADGKSLYFGASAAKSGPGIARIDVSGSGMITLVPRAHTFRLLERPGQ